jgi:hypothetical protein
MPTRLYYSSTRRCYALFYHPMLSVFRQRKIDFHEHQYRVIPQQLDAIESAERSIKIQLDFGSGLLAFKKSFYCIEFYFRSKRDIYRIRTHDGQTDNTDHVVKSNQVMEETDIWETVMDKKEQHANNQQTLPSKRTLQR